MTDDDVLFGYRLRLFTLADELGNVSEACRQMGVDRSTYYRWKPKLERYGLDGLRVRERLQAADAEPDRPSSRAPSPGIRIGSPGLRPTADSPSSGVASRAGIEISEHGIWRVLRRFNLNTRNKRHSLIARHADPLRAQARC